MVVFLSGAVVMVLELTGSRVLAPYIGTSIFVWTSLIGTILASLSLGYWWGGRKADNSATEKKLSGILFLSSLLVLLTALVAEPLLMSFASVFSDIRISALVFTILLFAPASILLGMVSPYAVKLKMNTLKTSGRTVGNLYALSTVGSIVGTYLAGYVLFAYLSTIVILYLLAGVLLISSFLANVTLFSFASRIGKFFLIIIVSWLFAPLNTSQNGIDIDTLYNRVRIVQSIDSVSGKRVKELLINEERSSAQFVDSDELVYSYTKFYRLASHFNPTIKKALMIGAGAYSYPKDFLKQFPLSDMDVVEIDPGVTTIAQTYFGLQNDSRLNIFHEDARTFINRGGKTYDAIFGDAFRSYTVPFQLTTREAVSKLYSMLNDGGVVLINLVSSLSGPKSKFLQAEYLTYASIFPQVYIFPVTDYNDSTLWQNVILVGLKSSASVQFTSNNPELQSYLSHVLKFFIPDGVPVLRDTFAPVEFYISVYNAS